MRRISPGTITVAVFAILLGLVAAFFAKQAFVKKETPEPTRQEPGERVVVARENLEPNDRIARRILSYMRLNPGEKPPENYIANRDVAAGRYVSEVIPAGEPITSDMLHPIGMDPRRTFRDDIGEGMRAKTINVAGLVHGSTIVEPGSYVDVSITVETNHPQVKTPDLKGILTKTLLKSIRVIGVVRPQERYRGRSRNRTTTVIVEVTPDQSDVLTLAEQLGTLTMSLVGPNGAGEGGSEDVISPNELLALVNPPPPPPPSLPFRAEHYRGTRVDRIEFGVEKILESRSATAAQHHRTPSPKMWTRRDSPVPDRIQNQQDSDGLLASDGSSEDAGWAAANDPNLRTRPRNESRSETPTSFVTTLEEIESSREQNNYVGRPRRVPRQQPRENVSAREGIYDERFIGTHHSNLGLTERAYSYDRDHPRERSWFDADEP